MKGPTEPAISEVVINSGERESHRREGEHAEHGVTEDREVRVRAQRQVVADARDGDHHDDQPE